MRYFKFLTSKKVQTTMIVAIVVLATIAVITTKNIGVGYAATSTSDLQSQINDRNTQIQALQKEIAQYQVQLETLNKSANTLSTNIKQLDASRQKFIKQIALAQNQIDATSLDIEKLNIEIGTKQSQIGKTTDALAETMRQVNQKDKTTLIETFLSTKTNPSALWDYLGQIKSVQKNIDSKITELKDLNTQLLSSKTETEQRKNELLGFESELADQKKLVDVAKKQKDTLLAQTKNQQSSYQKLINDKKALENKFNQELVDFESQLKLQIDPNSVPGAKSGVLSWPVDKVVITQLFGDTEFSRTTTAYNGHGHNGIDLGVPIGTPIKAALSGTVKGTGNTDTVCPNASYGKWVFIQHANGLSTLYAHLSVIKVTVGQTVGTGEVLGYSGETGYATGPHLHFTVYATQGVEIANRKSAVCKGTYTMPLADLAAYLNPLNYLPSAH